MMNSISNWWSRYSSAGQQFCTNHNERRAIVLINRICFIMVIVMSVFFVFSLIVEAYYLIYFCVITASLAITPYYLNKFGKLQIAKIWFCLVPVIAIAFICMYNPKAGGDIYFLFPASIVPVVLFKQNKTKFSLFAINIFVFFYCFYYQSNHPPLKDLNETILPFYFTFNMLAVFSLMLFLLIFYSGETEIYEREIMEKNDELSQKNTEVFQSISYAKRLQDAILPPDQFIKEHLPLSFIMYLPKDIIAGDFYWVEKSLKSETLYVAAADCTGHGVPGAMVSVVCSNALDRALKEFNIVETGKILDKTRELVLETFSKGDSDVKDGMDISLVSITRKNNGGAIIEWSGANNPLWYTQNKAMKFISADKQPIGKTDDTRPFTTHRLELEKQDTLYLFTDGFADQFGGPKGKKLKYKPMQELLLKNTEDSMENQKTKLNNAFTEWKGKLEQVDDVVSLVFNYDIQGQLRHFIL